MSSSPRPKVLAVDDDPGVREAYAFMFESWADVVAADGAAAALEAARHDTFDAIILDVRMPVVSGVEAFAPLRAAQPRAPIVFVTAVDTAETAIRAMRLGAFDYVTKPFEMSDLVAIVRRAVASTAGVVSVVGRDTGACAAAAVLAAACAGVPIVVGAMPEATRTVHADGRTLAALYMDLAPGAAPPSEFIARVATYVGAHYAHVKVERVAAAVGLSAGHLSRVFREETRLVAKEFITRVRLEVARYRLRETRETLEVIAERVGLCDAPHLARIFRQHTGETPGAYRASQAPGGPLPPD
jgi:YesN/AraC family two-component response regulator